MLTLTSGVAELAPVGTFTLAAPGIRMMSDCGLRPISGSF